MRGAIRSLAVVAMTATAALALAGCTDDSKSESSATATTTTAAAPKASDAVLPGEPVQCGTGPWGLAVVAHTTKGAEFCPHAVAVVDAYAAQRRSQPDGDISVTVDNMPWVCGERQGDPNPFQECASQNESADNVRLYS